MLKRLVSFVLLVAMLLTLCACGGQGAGYDDLMDELASAAPSAEVSEEPEEEKRTLTFAFWGLDSMSTPMVNHAKAYMAQHPDVAIEVEIFDFLEYSYAAYSSEIAVRLMAGEGPDVLGWIPDLKMLQSGQFLDLYPYMENDPEFHEEDYYMDILTGLETEGELNALSVEFYCENNCYAMRSDLDPELAEWFETAETVTYADMIAAYEKLAPKQEGLMIYSAFLPTDALWHYSDTAIDLTSNECNFEIPELADLLKRSWGFPTVNVTITPETGTKYTVSGGAESYQALVDPAGQELFAAGCEGVNIYRLFPYEGKVFTMPRLIQTAGGQKLYTVSSALSIARTCEDPELAWDFIRFCIEDKEKAYDHMEYYEDNGYLWSVATMGSVNRDNYARVLRIQAEQAYYNAATIGGLKPLGDREQAVSAAVDYLLTLPDQLDACKTLYSTGDLWPEQYLFLTGETTAEEFLTAVQNKVSIYIKE